MIVFYDGDCGLCQRSIRILHKYDKKKQLKFAPLNGVTYKNYFGETPSDMKTLKVYLAGNTYEKSNAVIELSKILGGAFLPLGFVLSLVPECFRDWIYKQIADRRKSISCIFISKDERFLP